MLFYLTFRIISSISAFLYPGYASYKTLSQRPASEEELERWLMYWSVLGCIVGVEYVAEWLISWLPFYYPLKTLFLLYLALPQTQGSSYLYVCHLKPFFTEHETQIDAGLASLKTRVYAFAQEKLRAVWNHIAASTVNQGDAPGERSGVNAGTPPTLTDPVSGPVQTAMSFWRSYGPSILATSAAFMNQSSAASASASNRALNESPPLRPSMPPSQSSDTQSILERRRQLEAELASLPSVQMPVPEIPMPSYVPPSRGSPDSDLRERIASGNGGGRFEEVEVPSDYEGEGGPGYARSQPQVQRRSSWFFGWGGQGQGYERVKTD
ncbi:receptor expression-enhancing protein 4 [Neolentinus lepideus HHB14362 ss-1]|uniref:Protein YOP1 n=1 Tax=Neolentinus lepideus HHB14362 ss-1 TaxID=1314782 RepID=A0A165UJR3_9AGAM|nr:receptor expression-enhancing protein 4 [Neolentinus lepideus HHB14362 ss-1]